MPDIYSRRKRSAIMAAIRSRGNVATELAVARLFRLHKIIGWRRHVPIRGRPDFLFSKAKVAIFVDGCFWHGCPVHFKIPQSNREFWDNKVRMNKRRDRSVTRQLEVAGWVVLRVWQHDLRSNTPRFLLKLIRILSASSDPRPPERRSRY